MINHSPHYMPLHEREIGQKSSGVMPENRKKIEQAAELFEAQFIREMFKQMRNTTSEMADKDSVFSNSIHNDMMTIADGAIADSLAKNRLFGIADIITRQLLPQQSGTINLKSDLPAVALPEESLAAFAAPLNKNG